MRPLIFLFLLAATTIAAAEAKSPAEAATAALARQDPHIAHYVKLESGEKALDVVYRSPEDITLRVTSPDGTIAMALDPAHLYIRIDDRCARLPAAPFLADLQTEALRPQVQLEYRITPEGSVVFNTVFRRLEASEPPAPPLLWLAELSAADTRLTRAKAEGLWWAEREGVRWSVEQKTGRLHSMAAGPHAIRLDTVTLAPQPGKAKRDNVPAAGEICPQTTDPDLARYLEGQIRLQVIRLTLSDALLVATAEGRAEAAQQQQALWQRYFAAEMPRWASLGLAAGSPWWMQSLSSISDPAAFQAFQREYAFRDPAEALSAWKTAWYQQLGAEVLDAQLAEVRQVILQDLAFNGDPAVLEELLLRPLQEAAWTTAEEALRQPLTTLVETGAAALPPPPAAP